jgi:von Willebrand factor type A domain
MPVTCVRQVLNSMASLDIEGEANFAAAVQIAQLALKHRQNKNQRQRIVIFVGSPLAESQVWQLAHLTSTELTGCACYCISTYTRLWINI